MSLWWFFRQITELDTCVVLCQYHQWLLLWLDPWLFALAAASFFACFAAFIWSRCCWARSRLFMPEKRFSRAFRLHLILRHARILTQPLAQCRVKCKKGSILQFWVSIQEQVLLSLSEKGTVVRAYLSGKIPQLAMEAVNSKRKVGVTLAKVWANSAGNDCFGRLPSEWLWYCFQSPIETFQIRLTWLNKGSSSGWHTWRSFNQVSI